MADVHGPVVERGEEDGGGGGPPLGVHAERGGGRPLLEVGHPVGHLVVNIVILVFFCGNFEILKDLIIKYLGCTGIAMTKHVEKTHSFPPKKIHLKKQ